LSPLVVDCSVTMAWCFQDESASYADAALETLAEREAVVPSIWPLEVANVLLVAERRGRLKRAETTRFLALLSALPITVDRAPPHRSLEGVLALAREQHLSAYDAAYLELAMRLGGALATLDESLRRAAEKVGLSLFDPRQRRSKNL